MNHASLFSGIGGAELAASWMGWHNAFHCEIQEFPRKVLEYWFPNSESYEDITKTNFAKWHGKVDVLTGGFPCQPFSLAGRRKGADDNRYLWPHMLRAIREIQPTWVVGENVAGIKTMVESCQVAKLGRSDDIFEENHIYREESKFTLDKICQDLEEAGYSVQPLVIPACAVGAPHRRDRVWIVAHRADARAETMQQGRQDGVHAARSSADSQCNGLSTQGNGNQREGKKESQEGKNRPLPRTGRHGNGFAPSNTNGNRPRRRKNKQEPFAQRLRASNLGTRRKKWAAANSYCDRDKSLQPGGRLESSRSKRDVQPKERCFSTKRNHGLSGFPLSSDSMRFGLGPKRNEHGNIEPTREGASKPCTADSPQGWWRNFPTQPPVCRGNDGLPFDVENLTISFSKWRQESIKAYGNAWVPQVAYEIFRAIEEISL